MNAELVAGSTLRNILRVDLREAPAFRGAIENNQSSSLGSIQGNLEVSQSNLPGLGDSVSLHQPECYTSAERRMVLLCGLMDKVELKNVTAFPITH
ncbi:hypothetical protein [Phormidesmis sp. 146-33]